MSAQAKYSILYIKRRGRAGENIHCFPCSVVTGYGVGNYVYDGVNTGICIQMSCGNSGETGVSVTKIPVVAGIGSYIRLCDLNRRAYTNRILVNCERCTDRMMCIYCYCSTIGTTIFLGYQLDSKIALAEVNML